MFNAEQVADLIARRDWQGLMFLAARAWLATYYPEAKYAAVSAEMGVGLPSVVVPITPKPSASPSPGPS